jgi:hypothetical protein
MGRCAPSASKKNLIASISYSKPNSLSKREEQEGVSLPMFSLTFVVASDRHSRFHNPSLDFFHSTWYTIEWQ